MKKTALAFLAISLCLPVLAQVNSITADKDWAKQEVVVKNSTEADCIIRIGDVDNLGFGWPENFDPFCGRMTEAHSFPWQPADNDLPGFDRILLSSKFNFQHDHPCGSDGYTAAFDKVKSKPVTWNVPLAAARQMTIQNAWLQLFIDDFQAPTFCSQFQLFINGKHFVEGEKILNAIDQTGPVGKLISIPLTEDLYPVLAAGGELSVLIDEAKGASDGFAIDFLRLLINRKRENSCKGTIHGKVLIKGTETAVPNAKVSTADNNTLVTTNEKGEFTLKDIPTGFEVISASASGFTDGAGTADIGQGDENPELVIYLERGRSAKFNDQTLTVGQSITLDNILFDQGKADIKPESKATLDKLVAFLITNRTAEIELSGHTSSEGERNYNKSLSYQRVKACKEYIVSKGVGEDRIIAIGFGPDRPVAPNNSEANRAKNRRVEMRLKKL
ncbi:MAG: OmpA family protein [Ferruginibacter sp.]